MCSFTLAWPSAGEQTPESSSRGSGLPKDTQPVSGRLEQKASQPHSFCQILLSPPRCRRSLWKKNESRMGCGGAWWDVRSSWLQPFGCCCHHGHCQPTPIPPACPGPLGGLATHCPALNDRQSSRQNRPTAWFLPCGQWPWMLFRT